MRKRVRQIHAQALVRRSDYRQRHLAKGTWMRLRRELAISERVFVLSPEEEHKLVARGFETLAVGEALHPKKRLYRVDRAQLSALEARADEVPVGLNQTFLSAEAVALVPFMPLTGRVTV
ncbi:MAG: hypothetical protein AAGA56_29600 [Myxococcota bacterium]